MGKVLRGPWPVPHQERRSCSILSEDIRFISIETRQALQHERASFNMRSDINPIHCRKALNVLEGLHARLDRVSLSLSQNTSLAIILSPSRYPVLIDLCLTQKSTAQLMEQLDGYRVSCLKPSAHLYPKRREIIALFDKILRQLENIPGLIMSLEQDIETQGHKLNTMVQPDTFDSCVAKNHKET